MSATAASAQRERERELDSVTDRPSADSQEPESADDFLKEIARAPRVEPPPPERDRTGDTIGRFRIHGKLGQGGMGVVYAATDSTLGREVALKLLPGAAVGDEQRRLRFLREARSASLITHPSIATVFDVGEDAGTVFIAMERVVGMTLRCHLDEAGDGSRGLPPREAARILRDVAAGVARAHQARVIHRDLKPDNVMITPDGAIKILDFGLAKLDGPEHDDASGLVSREGRIVGTPCYMSPEQARGREVDPRSDVFSLGVLLYELCTGARPFAGDTAMEIAIAIDRDKHPPVRELRASVPAALEQIIDRCLEKDRERRFSSCDDLRSALDEFLAARPSRSRLVGWPIVLALALAIGLLTLVALLDRDSPRSQAAASDVPPGASGAPTPPEPASARQEAIAAPFASVDPAPALGSGAPSAALPATPAGKHRIPPRRDPMADQK